MRVNNRFFEAGTSYKLCAFEITEGEQWSPPERTELIYSEPIVEDGSISGFYVWALVLDSKMHEVMEEHRGDQ